jgi:hypothetical protein
MVLMPTVTFLLRGTGETAKPTETLRSLAKGRSELKEARKPLFGT